MATKPLKPARSCTRSRQGNYGKALERAVLRFYHEILEQLDDVASFASLAVGRGVPRSAMIRAARSARHRKPR
jgi:hypothetical protein